MRNCSVSFFTFFGERIRESEVIATRFVGRGVVATGNHDVARPLARSCLS